MLCTGMLNESLGGFDGCDRGSITKNKLAEFWQQMGRPSVRCVDYSPGSYHAPVGCDFDPTVCVSFRDFLSGSVCLQVQVALFENDPQDGMHELVWPSIQTFLVTFGRWVDR